MRLLNSRLLLLALGAVSLVEADTLKLYDQPVKRSFLDQLLGIPADGNDAHGRDGHGHRTVTETVQQTITVGSGGGGVLGGQYNNSRATATQTVTVTQIADGAKLPQAQAVTVTQFATMAETTTMVQLIACATAYGVPIPAAEASIIASSIAQVVSSGEAAASSSALAASSTSSAMTMSTSVAIPAASSVVSSTPTPSLHSEAPSVASSSLDSSSTSSATVVASSTSSTSDTALTATSSSLAIASSTLPETSPVTTSQSVVAYSVANPSSVESVPVPVPTTSSTELTITATTTTTSAASATITTSSNDFSTPIAFPVQSTPSLVTSTSTAAPEGQSSIELDLPAAQETPPAIQSPQAAGVVPPGVASLLTATTFAGANQGPPIDLNGVNLSSAIDLGPVG
ncbi:hypothetical protein F5Y17DRAFT_478644 [Xylariaceae sp. FL0594]|nr:hypothetical protein F5Y17DRAFT_478644 [Xylariaceae sp. FL0594]